jgi:thiamine biosynthesis protein ThiS
VFIKINGTESEISDNISIQSLVSTGNLPEKAIIIELNGTIIQRKLWESTELNPGDSLEIIRIIGGG